MRIRFFSAFLLSTFALAVSPRAVHGAPSLSIGTLYELIRANQTTLMKRIRNNGDATAFVRVEMIEIVNENGKTVEHPVPTTDLMQGGGVSSLIARPARLIIPARSMQTIRMLPLGPRDKERHYRARFIPVMPDKQNDFSLTEEQREKYRSSQTAVLAGYGALVMVHPKETRFETQAVTQGTKHIVRNAGNAAIVLEICATAISQGQLAS